MLHDLRLLCRMVFCFQRVGLVIVEFQRNRVGRCAGCFPLDEAMALGADGAAKFFLWVGVIRMIAQSGLRIFERGDEAEAIDGLRPLRYGETGELGKRGKDVHAPSRLASAAAGLCHAGGDEKQRDAVRLLVVRVFCPDAEITEVEAVPPRAP